jgi:anti-anti-sigma factor
MLAETQQVRCGPLTVNVAQDGSNWTVALQGELDLSTAEPVQRQLDVAMTDPACKRLVLDMAQLEFIDSTGIAVLLRTVQRDAGFDRLRVVPSTALGVTRVLQLTGIEQRLAALYAV